jgi:hypothetical protein
MSTGRMTKKQLITYVEGERVTWAGHDYLMEQVKNLGETNLYRYDVVLSRLPLQDLKRIVRRAIRCEPYHGEVGKFFPILDRCLRVRNAIAHSKKEWPDYHIPPQVFRWWRYLREDNLSKMKALN